MNKSIYTAPAARFFFFDTGAIYLQAKSGFKKKTIVVSRISFCPPASPPKVSLILAQ
jgi:hypothetical protein